MPTKRQMTHKYQGLCPSIENNYKSRDETCPACLFLMGGGKVLEKDIDKQIAAYLTSLNAFQFKVFGSGYSAETGGAQMPGLPDRFACIPLCINGEVYGLSIWIEVKRPGGRLSERQKEVISRMRASGVIVLVVYSVKELKDGVQQLIKERVG